MKDVLKIGGEFHRLFLSLKGEWKLLREYSNGSKFEGAVFFDYVDEHIFSVKEDGNLSISENASPMSAQREWQWQLTGDADIEISYPAIAGGALYHALNLKSR